MKSKKYNVWEIDSKQHKFIGWSLIGFGIIFSLSIIGLIIGIPLIVVGVGFLNK